MVLLGPLFLPLMISGCVEYGRADQDTKNSSDDFGIMQVKAGYSLAQKKGRWSPMPDT